MEHQIPDIEADYGIRAVHIIKNKYFYIINAKNAVYRLYPFSQGSEELIKLYEANRLLVSGGAPVYPMLTALDGRLCTEAGEKIFMLTLAQKGREPSPANKSDVRQMLLSAARVHKILRACPTEAADTSAPYQKGAAVLTHIRSIINRKNKLSDIDKLFMKNYESALGAAKNAAEAVKSGGLAASCVYGSPKEENFLLSDRAYITNWNNYKTGLFVNDLAYMIKRFVKKADTPAFTPEEMREIYESENPMSDKERAALDIIFAYPEKYISILKEYYGKHRPFAPVCIMEKLERELRALK